MHGFTTLYALTLAESRRRKILLATLLCGLAFLSLYGTGYFFIHRDMVRQARVSLVEQRMILGTFTIAGLYAVNFLMIMTAVLVPVDTLSGEIASGVMQTIAAKPVRRPVIVLGKWAAHATVLAGYLALMAG